MGRTPNQAFEEGWGNNSMKIGSSTLSQAALAVSMALILLGSRALAPLAAQGNAPGMHPAGIQEQLLYSFMDSSGNDHDPQVGLVRDAAGNLYGTTLSGGNGAAGNVFELSPLSGGGWTETVLHNFKFGSGDGNYPSGDLIMDMAGNLYGTTGEGGSGKCGTYGCGTVFEVSPQSGGGWAEMVLYSFAGSQDGVGPIGLVLDAAGNLYGTTGSGCSGGGGIIFELSLQSDESWSETILYAFTYPGLNGYQPDASLVFDPTGDLYGTTKLGGHSGQGTVFELSPKSGGGWIENVLYSFKSNGKDGENPSGSLVFDASGNLYGTTPAGGSAGQGTVYELSPNSGGGWTERRLHTFLNNGSDGEGPYSGLVFDLAGNLYGTTVGGGSHFCPSEGYGCGTVFELSPGSGGVWTEKVLHNFKSGQMDSHFPFGGVTLDPAGNLYGTTALGGAYGKPNGAPGGPDGGGTVFKLTP